MPDVETLEKDLRTLAGRRGGFNRPEGLAEELKVLPDLHAVIAASGGKRSRVQRIHALHEVVRTAVDRIVDRRTRLAASVYLFVLTEDELAEHDLPSSLWDDGLGDTGIARRHPF